MNFNNVKDIVTIISSIFSVAVAIKTLTSKNKKHSIYNYGDNNHNVINEKQVTIINKTDLNDSRSTKQYSHTTERLFLTIFIIFTLIAIFILLVSPEYIVVSLSVLNLIVLITNIKRIKVNKISENTTIFISIYHILLALLIFSTLFIPQKITDISSRFPNFNTENINTVINSIHEFLRMTLYIFHLDNLHEGGIFIILQLWGLSFILFSLIKRLRKKEFLNLTKKFEINPQKRYYSLFFQMTAFLILLHSYYLIQPLLEYFQIYPPLR